MDLVHLREILELVAECDVSEVEIEEENLRVVIRKHPPVAIAQPLAYSAPPVALTTTSEPEVSAPETSGTTVHAPIVGTFYTSSSPDSDPFINVGDRVTTGDVLCIIEAMKLMNEIECEVSGIVTQILVEDATPVEYDQPLFIIDPS